MNRTGIVYEILICFVVFGFGLLLSYRQYQMYMNNHDISSISYRRYNSESKDDYPSFSICLYSSFGMIFKRDKNILGLKGWEDGSLYRKILLGEESVMDKSRISEIDFDAVGVNILDDIIDTFQIVTKQETFMYEYKKLRPTKKYLKDFVPIYQDPNQICVTRNRIYTKRLILNYELLKLDADLLYNITADLHIYIHKPGSLTRILHKPTTSFSLYDFKEMVQNSPPKLQNNHYHFNINYVEVIQNRPDGITPCNETLHDDDAQYRQVVTNKVGCIPAYWKRFFRFSSTKLSIQSLPDCVHQEQLYEISKFYLPDLNVENATKLYLEPCRKMKTVISVKKTSVNERKKLVLQFDYTQEDYKVFQNT